MVTPTDFGSQASQGCGVDVTLRDSGEKATRPGADCHPTDNPRAGGLPENPAPQPPGA